MSARHHHVRAAALVALTATTGCSVILDTVYLAGNRKFDTSTVEREPTSERWQGIEYAARSVEGGIELSCTQATRSIDRQWSVHRTWQRRGGYDRNAYFGTAFISGFFGAITGGVLLGMCLSEDSNVDCAWTAASAPLFVDMGYGLIRRSMTKEPKLIARERSGDSIALGAVIDTQPIACPALTSVAIGYASGHDPAQALAAETPEPQRLNERDSTHLPVAGGIATLTPVVAESWSAGAGLWAIDADGIAHAVTIDRCAVLRPYIPGMSTTNQNRVNAECPLPPGTLPPSAPVTEPAPEHAHHTGHHGFEDAAQWAKTFDDPARDAWQQPTKVVGYLAIAPGMIVADVGAGTGYFSAHLARAVGPRGRVLALDPEPAMATYLADRAQREGTPNVEARRIAADDPGLAPASTDRILIVNTWHHIADREAYARKLRAALAPGGRIAIVDFTLATDKGPPTAHRLPPERVADELARAGLVTRTITELPDQYVVIGELR